jgi:hypothetical protein
MLLTAEQPGVQIHVVPRHPTCSLHIQATVIYWCSVVGIPNLGRTAWFLSATAHLLPQTEMPATVQT